MGRMVLRVGRVRPRERRNRQRNRSRSGGGIGFGLCEDITHAVIDEEKMTSLRKYHTITEAKNGAGATPIKTEKGWIHIAHGVRNTAAGLR